MLPDLISNSQNAFVKGRFMSDNVMIVQELLHGCDRNNISPKCMAKIDLQKTYDSIEWRFLADLFVDFKFSPLFTNCLMTCICSPYFSININGGVHRFFKDKRGIRQGDPISPYIFDLAIEYLTRCFKVMSRHDKFDFHPMCKKESIVNLSFADILMIVCKATHQCLHLIK